ncbi:MAG: hypothetical protein ACI4UF_08825 [Thermoguttaceae bacterium]
MTGAKLTKRGKKYSAKRHASPALTFDLNADFHGFGGLKGFSGKTFTLFLLL